MNSNYIPRIIPASAGTGKTYRLSLEFIGLLIKYRQVLKFDEIVVITFTRKATAEIRARIISFLKKLALKEDNYLELEKSLSQYYPEIQIDQEFRSYLNQVYQSVITSKSQLKISTLDAFINQIFRSLIAPYYNISDYDIDPECNEKILPQLYETLLSDHNYQHFKDFFDSARLKTVSQYNEFINAILSNRWLFEFYFKAQVQEVDSLSTAAQAYKNLQQAAHSFCWAIAEFMAANYPDESLSKVFLAHWKNAISNFSDQDTCSQNELYELLYNMVCDKFFLKHHKSLAATNKSVIGKRILNKHPDFQTILEENTLELYKNWLNYLFHELALPQQEAILKIARILFAEYDKIKFHQKVFTYDDLTAYTWKSLYNDEISLIQDNEVLNIFYEQLAYRIKFILIDEFQDTSIIQWNIFAPLINELVAGSGISEVSGLIIVGDEKQSIYGWRSGERNLLIDIKNILNCQTQAVPPLTNSYRSSKNIINFVNGLFGDDPFQNLTRDLQWTYPQINSKIADEGFCQIQITNQYRNGIYLSNTDIVKEFVINTLKPALEANPPLINPQNTAILTRSNKQVKTICSVLRDEGIDYLNEAGYSILKHRAVLPLIYLLKWFNNLDFYSLILFFRSNAVLMPSIELKKILNLYKENKNSAFSDLIYSSFAHLPVIASLHKIHPLRDKPLELIKQAIKLFNFNHIFNLESDCINLQKFLDLTAGFSQAHDWPQNLSGLLQYLTDNEKSQDFSQIGVQKQSAVKVMTIHKSKGLEFETVILMLSSKKGGNRNAKLEIFPEFVYNYSELTNAFFTCNYRSLLEHSQRSSLYQLKEIKEKIEEINLWYVALTRPKRNLFLLFDYKNKKGVQEYLKNYPDNTQKIMIHSILTRFADYNISTSSSETVTLGNLLPADSPENDNLLLLPSQKNVSHWYEPPGNAQYIAMDNWQKNLDAQALINSSKAALFGNIAHYYLQNIDFDSATMRKSARDAVQNFYGSLVQSSVIDHIVDECNCAMAQNPSYFDPKIWDSALCEFSVFDKFHKEHRIDRLLVSHSRQEIMIIDYKTGKIHDPAQIHIYNQIVSNIPFVKKNNFTVIPGQYLIIDLS